MFILHSTRSTAIAAMLPLLLLLPPLQWTVDAVPMAAPSASSQYTIKAVNSVADPSLNSSLNSPLKSTTSTSLPVLPSTASPPVAPGDAKSRYKRPTPSPRRTAARNSDPIPSKKSPKKPSGDKLVRGPASRQNNTVHKTSEEVKPTPTSENDENKDLDDASTSPEFTWQTFVIIVITILIVLSNCAIIMVVAWTDAFGNFNKIFIYSLTCADLLIGLCITPYSIFLSVYKTWVFESKVFCSVEAYMFTTLISAKMYSLTWLNVDQYVAVRKPERYNSMMTPARSLCWICFSWVVGISFCCPPLFSFQASIFDGASYICIIDTKQQIAYVLTAGVLVYTPSMVTTVITGAYLFTKSFKKQIQFYEKVFVDLSSRPWNYHITFTMSAVFFGVWFPFTCVYTIKYFLYVELDQNLLFVLCWLGISTGFSQFVVLFVMSPDFRRALKELIHFPEICRRSPNGTDSLPTGSGIETVRRSPPPAYLTYFERQDSQDGGSSNKSPSPRSLSKGSLERRKQSQRSGTQGSGSTSTSSIPYVDALGSVTGMQYRGVSSSGTPPTHV